MHSPHGSQPECCTFCPRKPVDTVDIDGERGVPVCAECGALRVTRGLAAPTPTARKPRVTRADRARIATLRETARKGVLW